MMRLSTGFRNKLLWDASLYEILKYGAMYIYNGAQPASADHAPPGTLLALVTANGAPFAPGYPTNGLDYEQPTNGILHKKADQLWRFMGLEAGTAGWFRLVGNPADPMVYSTTVPRIDGLITGGSPDLHLLNTTIEPGVWQNIDRFQIALPSA